MEALITELCVHGKYYYAKTKVHSGGEGATHGQMIWRVDELFRLGAENPALEIPKIRKFLSLLVEEAALHGCTPCFFRSIIRIYCPRAGDGHQHHDKGVRGARLVSQCSFQRAAEHELQFFISEHSPDILFKAITRGTEAFSMGKILSGTDPSPQASDYTTRYRK